MEFALACALTEGRVSLAELTDETACRPDIVALMAKVQCTTTDETMLDLPFAPEDRVRLVLDGGEVLEAPPVTHAKGSWQRQMNDTELREKFRDCTSRQLSPAYVESLFERLCTLQSVDRLRDLQLVAKSG